MVYLPLIVGMWNSEDGAMRRPRHEAAGRSAAVQRARRMKAERRSMASVSWASLRA